MIEFNRVKLQEKQQYNAILFSQPEHGCEYSFANKYLWGRQQIA